MATDARRARRAGALATEIEALVAAFGVPLETHAVRVLLADRDRPATVEHLGRVAAGERAEHLRTRLPPRLGAAILPDGALVAPRWWAGGDWRLQRRILTEDARPLWLARLAERICAELLARRRPPSRELKALVRGTLARLGLDDEVARTPDAEDWQELRALVLDHFPDVVFTHEVSTAQQHDAEQALLAADLPAVDRYFGVSRHRRGG